MKLILINGPKGSGKDTLAQMILDRIPNTRLTTFKTVLYKETARRLNVDLNWLIEVATDRTLKETPLEELGGISPRQALIDTSEDHIKKEHGPFGVSYHLVEDILSREYCGRFTFVIPDSGFNHEVNYLTNVLKKFGLSNLTVIRLDRDGCTYEGDSREYLDNPDIHLHNNGSPEELYQAFIKEYKS